MIRIALAAFIAGSIAVAIGSGGGTPAGSDPGSADPYDLGPLPANVDDTDWPHVPVITEAPVTVSTQAGWNTYVANSGGAGNGRVITVNACSDCAGAPAYPGGSGINCSDCEVNFVPATVRVAGTLTFNVLRTRMNGGDIEGICGTGDPLNGGGSHLLLDNVRCESEDDATMPWARLTNNLALINSTFRMNNAPSAGWTWYSVPANPITDVIIANCMFWSSYQGMRIQAVTNFIMVDSYLNIAYPNMTQSLRIRYDSTDMFFARNIFGSGFNEGAGGFNNAHFEDNILYGDQSPFITNGFCGVDAVNSTTSGNQLYCNDGAITNCNIGSPLAVGTCTGTNPNVLQWDDPGAPYPHPAFPPESNGADH